MEDVQKKRKSRWGDAEKKNDEKTSEATNPVNILENINANFCAKPGLISGGGVLPPQFPSGTVNFPSLSSSIHLNILKATEAAKLAIEKAKRASRFKEEVKQNVRKVEFIPKPLKFDEQGREIDEEGNVINIKPITYSTLKVNINKLEENNILKKKTELLNKSNENYLNDDSKWFDSRIKNISQQKKKKKNAFNFITPGSIIKQANSKYYHNNKNQIHFDLKKIFEEKKKVQSFQELSFNFLNNELNSNVNPNLIDISNKKLEEKKDWNDDEKYNIIEKWDAVILKKIENKESVKEYINEQVAKWKDRVKSEKGAQQETKQAAQQEEGVTNEAVPNYDNSSAVKNGTSLLNASICIEVNQLLSRCNDCSILLLQNGEFIVYENLYRINMKRITHYIEHPVPLNEDKKEEVNTPHMFLTPLERKKLRKRKRQEKEREKQDKIRIGLIPPPPPKMKLSNLMRVLGDNAVAHPSRIEFEVREQMKERELRHYEQNQQRKLNPEEKSKKKINKWKSNTNEENEVLVIYISNLSNKKHIFKIDINAQQLHLTGVCIMTVLYNFIIVEGKHISIERYKRLIFRRIKWNEDEYEDDEDNDEEDENEKGDINKNKDNFNMIENFHKDYQNIMGKIRNCSLIWSGTVKKKNFENWKMLVAKTEMEVTEYLKQHNALQYYHIVKKHRNVLEEV
ncbi:U4/U6 small nuclear ribonucleoprotein PRP3, putative [Plasmodium ovale]|uniref:U4/U6 small nuclear ribonucleoprotein PRP3, putative n=2 Tax=Plasmodium ovale TaxID=36330 RepID=A0A1A8X042_PLAOA|nr:U4/U6 small nuclear ribonucleoprotein PRP3, putative [Plasmodium ovale curtisi]SBS97956.1 U4/U6 small nuclear ribonucleoprotein PRP3, putative [Plasmodium ovale curtisi]SCQ16735.1 U4/U6 small nuclear ribonucleoprotein PRP3, putative [Plasmodium ovale]